jgi:hypothetical protein
MLTASDWWSARFGLVPEYTTLDQLVMAHVMNLTVESRQLLTGRFGTISSTAIRDSGVGNLTEARTTSYRSQVLQCKFIVRTGVNAVTDGQTYAEADELLREFKRYFARLVESVDIICIQIDTAQEISILGTRL